MSNQDRIDDIIGLLREAELDEGVWSAASALIDEVCELRGNDLLLGRLNPQGGIEVGLRWLRLRGEPAPELARDYADNYAAIDERGRAGIRQAPGALAHTTALLPEGVRRTSATYNEYLVPNAGENCLNTWLPGVGDVHVAWPLVGPGAAIRATGPATRRRRSGSSCRMCGSS